MNDKYVRDAGNLILPATSLSSYYYSNMFNGCSGLTTAPVLPATRLAQWCYASMFFGCYSLKTAPALPATTLANYCYSGMFRNCTSLTIAPALPATTLTQQCYMNMFNGCSKLNNITMLATDVSATDCMKTWVNGVSSTGTFTKAASMTSLPSGTSGIPSGWTVINDSDYLTLSALEDGEITITISSDLGSARATYLSYSKDKSVWERTDINGRSKTITIPVSRGDNVYLKGKAKQWYDPSGPGGASINSSANINVSGNIMSLLYEDNFKDKVVFSDNSRFAFSWLFANNKHLCSAEKLILPATTLADGCYRFMFFGCSSLTTAPALPATKLVTNCYWGMFNGCTSLNSITMLATDISASNCLEEWVNGVAATGTFTKAASMTSLPSGTSGIPSGWTVVNK